jgi:hypothetical protein
MLWLDPSSWLQPDSPDLRVQSVLPLESIHVDEFIELAGSCQELYLYVYSKPALPDNSSLVFHHVDLK